MPLYFLITCVEAAQLRAIAHLLVNPETIVITTSRCAALVVVDTGIMIPINLLVTVIVAVILGTIMDVQYVQVMDGNAIMIPPLVMTLAVVMLLVMLQQGVY